MMEELIHAWLDSISSSASVDSLSYPHSSAAENPLPTPKQNIYPLSPQSSANGHHYSSLRPEKRPLDMSSNVETPKRAKRTHNATPGSATPRAGQQYQGRAFNDAASEPPSDKSSETSGASGRSARQKLSLLPLNNEGIVRQQMSLDVDNINKSIRDMLRKAQSIKNGRNFLSQDLRYDNFLVELLNKLEHDETAFVKNPEEPASSLNPSTATHVATWAKRCFEMDHDEPVWNVEVHHALLEAVWRKNVSSTTKQLGDFSLCSTASLIKEYLPLGSPDKKVDFCFYIDPAADSDPIVSSKARDLQRILPETSLNHTSYGALHAYPISAILETKRPGHDQDGAVLQLGVWQAAQWKMLRALLAKTAPGRLRQQGVQNITPDAVNADVTANLSSLGALHGLLVQGHSWTYVASSPEIPMQSDSVTPSAKTILWIADPFAHTTSPVGVHQVAAFLEKLKHWSITEYWPWYKRCFLY